MSEERSPGDPQSAAAMRTAETAARRFFRGDADPASTRRDVRRWLWGIVWSFVFIPAIFYLRFGEVGPLGWGATVFFAALCLLVAVSLHLRERAEYRTPVALRNGWLDWIGAFWLAACAFGPLFGWALTSAFELTAGNWQWFYWGRAGLSVVLPVLTALPLLRYVRGRGAPLMIALLLGVTALPVWSAAATLRDLRSGPVAFDEYTHLPHTGRVLTRP